MNVSGDQALDHALAFHREPGNVAAIRRQGLPADLLTVLRVAAGESEAVLQSAQRTGTSPEALREAAIFYLQQMLFAEEGDSYRVLGVNPDASEDRIKQHYRWLVRWLHPDRNADEWETVFADRVNRAWQDLRTPTRRNAYDSRRSDEPGHGSHQGSRGGVGRTRSMVPVPVPVAPSPHLVSARTVRWLPTIVLSGFALFAVVAMGLMYKLQDMPTTPAESVLVEGTNESVPAVHNPVSAPFSIAGAPTARLTAGESTTSATMKVPATPQEAVPDVPVSPPAMLPVAAVPAAEKPAPVAAPKSPLDRPVILLADESHPRNPIRGQEPRATVVAALPARARERAAAIRAQEPPDSVSAANAPVQQLVSLQVNPEGSGVIDDRIAASLVSRFSQAYATGDTERLMRLFTRDAQNGRDDRRAIAEEYRRLFERSERRRIALSGLSWLSIGEGAAIIASFETEVVPRGKSHGEHTRGDIRFDLREEEGELRIYRLSHDNRRG